ncbi:MAG TPA: hypothetical protein DCS91_08135 [Microcoleaceae bacterium UBA11344]|nr:hypothetical protein [Microcoleaceae cyanobacterium UBA11344]
MLFCTPSHQVYQRRGSVRAPSVAQFVLTFASLSLGLQNLVKQAQGLIPRMLGFYKGDRLV